MIPDMDVPARIAYGRSIWGEGEWHPIDDLQRSGLPAEKRDPRSSRELHCRLPICRWRLVGGIFDGGLRVTFPLRTGCSLRALPPVSRGNKCRSAEDRKLHLGRIRITLFTGQLDLFSPCSMPSAVQSTRGRLHRRSVIHVQSTLSISHSSGTPEVDTHARKSHTPRLFMFRLRPIRRLDRGHRGAIGPRITPHFFLC